MSSDYTNKIEYKMGDDFKFNSDSSLYNSDSSVNQLLSKTASTIDTLTYNNIEQACKPDQISKGPIGHFYEIRDGSGMTRGYLFGTVHSMNKNFFPSERMFNAMQKSDRLFVEILLDPESLTFVNQRVDRFLDALEPEELREGINRYLDYLSVHPLDGIAHDELVKVCRSVSPKEAFKLCYEQYSFAQSEKFGTGDCTSIDSFVQICFKLEGKKIFSLSTNERELEAVKLAETLFSQGYKLQMMNPDIDKSIESTDMTLRDWHKGKIPDIGYHLEGSPMFRISEERSGTFFNTILEDLQTSETPGFYAFGLAHLYDSQGVIAALESHNFQVVRITK